MKNPVTSIIKDIKIIWEDLRDSQPSKHDPSYIAVYAGIYKRIVRSFAVMEKGEPNKKTARYFKKFDDAVAKKKSEIMKRLWQEGKLTKENVDKELKKFLDDLIWETVAEYVKKYRNDDSN